MSRIDFGAKPLMYPMPVRTIASHLEKEQAYLECEVWK